MVDYKLVNEFEINKDFLVGFVREQLTKRVMYVKDGLLLEKDDRFYESWDSSKLEELSNHFKKVVCNGGKLVAAHDKSQIVGFALLDSNIFNDDYINLDYIHVSRDYRHLGIGRELFERISKEARKLNANKLYISGHPNIYTQLFYKKMGCVLAKKINERLFKEEPLDIHLEYDLYKKDNQ